MRAPTTDGLPLFGRVKEAHRRADPETSVLAARKSSERATVTQRLVLSVLKASPGG